VRRINLKTGEAEVLAPKKFAFDFFGTLDTHEDVRDAARMVFRCGHEVHIVSSISPGLPMDNDESYAGMLRRLNVPFTKIWRVDHNPQLKVAALREIGEVEAFWDDVLENVEAARAAGFKAYHVPHEPTYITAPENP
jgi:hypothetical protein